jgi:hypothetical protein
MTTASVDDPSTPPGPSRRSQVGRPTDPGGTGSRDGNGFSFARRPGPEPGAILVAHMGRRGDK